MKQTNKQTKCKHTHKKTKYYQSFPRYASQAKAVYTKKTLYSKQMLILQYAFCFTFVIYNMQSFIYCINLYVITRFAGDVFLEPKQWGLCT